MLRLSKNALMRGIISCERGLSGRPGSKRGEGGGGGGGGGVHIGEMLDLVECAREPW